MRLASTASGPVAVGLDLSVAFTMGAALGIPARLIAEWMPALEQVMVSQFNKRAAGDSGATVLGMEGGEDV